MLFTKHFTFCFSAFLLSIFLVACGGNDTKPEEVVEQTEEQAVVIVETEEEKRERLRLLKLEEIGPNPYLSNAPLVSRQAKLDFSAAYDVLSSGDEATAEAMLLKIVDTYPELSGASYNLAVMKSGQGDNKAALKHLETTLSRNNFHLDARLLKAYIHRTEGDFAAAEKEYLDAIDLWGAFLPALKNLGILYDLYMGKLAEALLYYEEYNSLLATPDRQILGWSIDVERQMKKLGIKRIVIEQPVVEQVVSPESADAMNTDSTESATLPEAVPEAASEVIEPVSEQESANAASENVPVSKESKE